MTMGQAASSPGGLRYLAEGFSVRVYCFLGTSGWVSKNALSGRELHIVCF